MRRSLGRRATFHMKTKNSNLLTGFDELTKPWRDGSRPDLGTMPLETMYKCIEANFSPSRPNNLSRQNWRFTKELYIEIRNLSREKGLEKSISLFSGDKWANQVPTASGFCRSEDRGRRLDLVYESTDSTFVFYELKVTPASGDFIHAAIELLGYGLLYVFSRSLPAHKECRLMKAKTVHLRVLGTWDYYEQQINRRRIGPTKEHEEGLSVNVNQFASNRLPGFNMDFGFDTFLRNFSWSVEDRKNKEKVLAALDGIHPLFS
jgi:hypothetical protein